MLTPVRNVDELDPGFWDEGMATFNQYVSRGSTLTDDAKFQATVDRVEALGAVGVRRLPHAGDHRSAHVAAAMAATRRSPSATVTPEPDQSTLEEIQRALLAMANSPSPTIRPCGTTSGHRT